MFVRYGKVYWSLANLIVDAGLVGEKEKNTNYDKLVSAIGKLDNILPCDINKSGLDFKVEGDYIRYGYRPIAGLDKDTFPIILENAPYISFDDFLDKVYYTKKLKEKKIITLIKTGSFDCFNNDRRALMIYFIEKAIPVRKTLSMVQFPILRPYIEGFEEEKKIYDFRNKITGKNKVKMNKELEEEFLINYSSNVLYEITEKGLVIDVKSFDNYYDKITAKLKEYLKTEKMLNLFARLKRRDMWRENCLGNISSWEMEVYYSYFGTHELDLMPIEEYYDLDNFFDMNEQPEIERYYKKTIDGEKKEFPIYKITRIGGTVIAKDRTRHYVTLLTKEGVVNVKLNKGQYAYYTAKYEGDDSWFERGNILIVTGYRKGLNFNAKAPKGGKSITKIVQYNSERIKLQTVRGED